jgi:hypothetical protein
VVKLYGIKWYRSPIFTKQLGLKSNKFSFIFSTKYHKIVGKLCSPIFIM